MNNWRIVGKIATGLGIVSVVFAVFAALLTYDFLNLQPGYYPASYVQLAILSSMLQYLLLAALSFVAAGFSMRAGKENHEKEELPPEAQPTETKT
jgi:H+/Cl- antiporter ClcA